MKKPHSKYVKNQLKYTIILNRKPPIFKKINYICRRTSSSTIAYLNE